MMKKNTSFSISQNAALVDDDEGRNFMKLKKSTIWNTQKYTLEKWL